MGISASEEKKCVTNFFIYARCAAPRESGFFFLIYRKQRITAQDILDVVNKQFLMLLFVLKAQLQDVTNLFRYRLLLQIFGHLLINIRPVLIHFLYRRTT